MSSPRAGRLAAKARMSILGLVALGLIGAAGLAYAAYRAHELNVAVSELPKAASLYRAQTAAIHQLSDMEKSLDRYLLDGNIANLSLMERDKISVEELVQQDPELKANPLLQEMVTKSQAWYAQAQLLVEQRKALPPGQGLSEDFLNRYRQAGPDLGVVNFEMQAESAFRRSLESLEGSQRQTKIGFLVASLTLGLLLVLGLLALAGVALRQVAGMRNAAG